MLILQNVKIINLSNKTVLAFAFVCLLLIYFFYLFNSCLLSSIHRAFHRVSEAAHYNSHEFLIRIYCCTALQCIVLNLTFVLQFAEWLMGCQQ